MYVYVQLIFSLRSSFVVVVVVIYVHCDRLKGMIEKKKKEIDQFIFSQVLDERRERERDGGRGREKSW